MAIDGRKLVIKIGGEVIATATATQISINPLSIMTEDQINKEMSIAIMDENYEYCAEIRDYLKSQRENIAYRNKQ